MQKCSQEVQPEVISSVTRALSLQLQEPQLWLCPLTITTMCAGETDQISSPVTEISHIELKKAQEEDPVLKRVRECVRTQQVPNLKH